MNTKPQITPSVGRKVWWYEYADQSEPIDATIIKVWDHPAAHPQSLVNLLVTDPHTGEQSVRHSVQVGDETTTWPHYRWMPYQQGRAAKELPLSQAPVIEHAKVFTDPSLPGC